MELKELLRQALQESDTYIVLGTADREITRDDVRAVAAVKAIRQRTPKMKSVDVFVASEEYRDDNFPNHEDTRVIRVDVVASSNGGDWTGRRIEATIPMIVSIDPYGEIGIECDHDRESQCVLRSTGRSGEGDMIDLPTFSSWLQHAAGKSLLREWLLWHGARQLVAELE